MAYKIFRCLAFILPFLLVSGCRPTPTLAPEITPSPTLTELPPPSETSIPLAAIVNGESILLEEFELELTRFQEARGTDLATDSSSSEIVLTALIERLLLAQGARSIGIVYEDPNINSEIEVLADEMGGVDTYQSWLQANHYSEATFKQAFTLEMYATAMIERIVSEVPRVELQAHARHILVSTEEGADSIQQELSNGADFGELAAQYSLDLSTKPGGGDLGWFATGTLTLPAVEELIFSLDPGETTAIVASEFGYHVVQLLALEERPLAYETLLARQEQAVENWLTEQMEQSEIEVFISS